MPATVIVLGKRIDDCLLSLAQLIVRHWLSLLALLTLLFLLPVVGYPLLMATDVPALKSLAGLIFLLYKPTCHQLPDRCLYVAGYQMAVCSRCFAIYAAFLAGCVAFAFVRRQLKIWSIKYYVLFCLPMAIDGTAQLLGIPIPRGLSPGWQLVFAVESTNEVRVITGAIFGLASALYVLPFLEEIFSGDPRAPQKNEPPAPPALASEK